MDRVTVPEAAHILGIKEESVRKRVSRGTLPADKDPDGRLLVYVTGTGTVRDESADRSVTDRDELVGELRDRVSSLERRLDEERESRRRADMIIAQLTQANAALTSRIPELEAPQESTEAAETVEEAPEGAEPRPDAPDVQEHDADTLREWTNDVERRRPQEDTRRPWWRRVFGG